MGLVLVDVKPFEGFAFGVALTHDAVLDFDYPRNEWRGAMVK